MSANMFDLFRQGKTVREISTETGLDEKEILLTLTKSGLWSPYCSECVVKRCYECKGLSELGKTVSIQDSIDAVAALKTMKV